MNQLFLQKVWLDDVEQTGYPYDLPAVQALKQGLPLGSPVVFLVGENGVGKSTLLEAMAAALGLNPEGGSRNARFATEETHTQLYQRLHLARGAVRPKDSYFVRGETLYNLATYLDGMENPWCEVPLHHHSHGEMMMELLYRRLGGGLYLMDEPEGALSPTRQMELLCRIRQMAKEGSQFIISTHSPILITCPGAEIWQVDEEGLHLTTYDKTDHFVVTREFLNHPEKMWKLLWGRKNMTYETAMALLEEKSKQGATPGLTRIRWLMKQLGNPQEQLQVIHVAGTNGKGSTVTMISQGLMACGCRVGKFTSPFIRRFTERITVDGEEISPGEVAALAEEVLALLPQMEQELGQQPTQFELVTAMAFCHFARKHCDYCVIEVGLGGLWDATNVISQPILSVITSISLDHTALLGSSLTDIARHKGGIIKEGRPVVCYPCWPKEVEEVILAQARQMHAPVVRTSPEEIENITLQGTGTSFVWRGKKVQLRLLGRHQCWNFCCAAGALTQLEGQDERIRQELWLPGVEGTSFVGRFQPVWNAPMVFLDGGHNREGVEATAAMLDSLPKEKRRIIVMGMMKDKDVEYCVSVMARRADVFVAVGSDYPRAMDAAGVAHLAEPYYPNVVKASTPSQGMALAWEMAKEDDILLGCGSLYFLGEMERKIQKLTNKVENRQN